MMAETVRTKKSGTFPIFRSGKMGKCPDFFLLLLLLPLTAAAQGPGNVSRSDVVWDSPSRDASGSMPLGNGEIALNAWVEPSGDLVFYIARTDSWDENGRLLKVGRVRVALDPKPRKAPTDFRQTLGLVDATLRVRWGAGLGAVEMRLWVDANRPVVRCEIDAAKPSAAKVAIEPWRTARITLPSVEVSDVMADSSRTDGPREPVVVEPDAVLPAGAGRIGWYHRNERSTGPALLAKIQGMGGFEREDPLMGRTFGAVVEGRGARRVDARTLRSPAARSHAFDIAVVTKHPATVDEWLRAVDDAFASLRATPDADRRAAHERWWSDFWGRSWIRVTPRDPADAAAARDAATVTRAYALQRFITACHGRGRYPIKFNGGLFTVPYRDRPGDADYRQWGPGYWWQNTRLPYFPMCAAGDFEMMDPLFRMYGRDLMPLFRYRTRLYLGHGGAFIPECIMFWGDVFSDTYGWTPFEERGADKLQSGGWHKYEWVSGLELSLLMLDRYDYTRDEAFLKETALPAVREILTFFDEHYPAMKDGTMVMDPSQALETWWDCTDPMPEIAGIRGVVERLQAIPASLVPDADRTLAARLLAKTPPAPTREFDGVTALAPAARFAKKSNVENPELYAVFPFRLFSFDRPHPEWALEALKRREDRGDAGWRQDILFMSYLGLAEDAGASLVAHAAGVDRESRFPGFWGPNYDWTPDQTHGGVLMTALQSMVLQNDGRKIFVLPAWPKAWDVDFKLLAPDRTTVSGTTKGGRLERLEVDPPSRRADVIEK